jgi:hypothetical protein
MGKMAPIMIDVACFCGCSFSFESSAAACPKCDEVATVSVGPQFKVTGHSQPEQPAAELNGARRNEQPSPSRWKRAEGRAPAGAVSR